MPNLGVYIAGPLYERMQRLKAKGVEFSASAVCQRCLEQAIDAEERALAGDRLARLLARVKSTRTNVEQVQADGHVIGRRWAEDTAALSEMRRVAELASYVEFNRLDAVRIEAIPGRVRVEFIHWPSRGDESEPWDPTYLPKSIPVDDLNQIATRDGISYTSCAMDGFVNGVTEVLDVVEEALRAAGEHVPVRRIYTGPDF